MPSSFRKKIELCPRLKLGVGRNRGQNQLLKIGAVICLTLALGLTLNAVRLVFGSKQVQNQALNSAVPQVLGASDVKTETTTPQAQFMEYKVSKGDTLFNVSQKFNISWTTLATLNNLQSPFTLKPGQTIKIPK